MLNTDWKMGQILEGRGFHVDVGALSTPIAGGGNQGAVILSDWPQLCISVPDGTSIIPIRIDVSAHVPLLAADSNECEILAAADIVAANKTSGTATAETAVNMRTGLTQTSKCTCRSAFSAVCTAPTLGLELVREVITGDVQSAASVLWTPLKLLYIPIYPPMLDGPCALYVYWGGTVAVSAFAQMEWLEFDSDQVGFIIDGR
jgi:hypothetical protein